MPRYAKRTNSNKLDPYAEKLATWLAIETTKSRKQRRNLPQIHTLRAKSLTLTSPVDAYFIDVKDPAVHPALASDHADRVIRSLDVHFGLLMNLFSMATKSRKKPAAVTEDEVFDIAADLFRAMAAPMRLKIVSLLCNGEKNVSELLAEIDTTQPNMSQHLNTLYQAGVLARRREGVSIYYSIANETVVALCRSICVQIAIEQE